MCALTRRALALGASLSAVPVLAACGAGQPASTGNPALVASELTPEIEFYHQHSAEFIDNLVAHYHQQQSRVHVRGVVVSGGHERLLRKIQLLASAGTPPAVAQAGFTYTWPSASP